MIDIDADLQGVAEYTGVVAGVMQSVKSDLYVTYFSNYALNKLRVTFNAETIASGMAGNQRIQHVFEWPDTDSRGVSTGRPSGIPLFRLDIRGRGKARRLTFRFVQSRRNVPLPDPERYGFKPNKLQYLRRHVFRFKAIVMETNTAVVVAPRRSAKLFVPSEDVKGGYYMTSKAHAINPGGEQATGGFSEWWTEWFATRADGIVREILPMAEEQIKATAAKQMRTIRSSGVVKNKTFSINSIKAKERSTHESMIADARYVFKYENDEEEELE